MNPMVLTDYNRIKRPQTMTFYVEIAKRTTEVNSRNQPKRVTSSTADVSTVRFQCIKCNAHFPHDWKRKYGIYCLLQRLTVVLLLLCVLGSLRKLRLRLNTIEKKSSLLAVECRVCTTKLMSIE
jgi:hypothetical protein